MTRPLMEIPDYIAELTSPHVHREHYTYSSRPGTTFAVDHVTKVPPLIHQLRYAAGAQGEERAGGGYESRPAAPLDSLVTLTEIDLEAARWVRNLGQDDPGDKRDPETGRYITGSGTIACLRILNGLAPGLEKCKKPARDCCTFHELERDIRSWYTRARIITGWDSPAWRPDNTCPMCDARGSLRIKLVDQIGFCVECRDTWDSTTISHLADHIRDESAGVRMAPKAIYCWCPYPRPAVDAWPSMCSACASPWCHRAGWARALAGPGDTPEHAWVS